MHVVPTTLQMVRRNFQIRSKAWATASLLPYLLPAGLPSRHGAGSVQAAAPSADVLEAVGLDELGGVMDQATSDLIAWRCFDDVVRRWLPTMDRMTLGAVIFDLREAPGAMWAGVRGDLANARDLLRLDVVKAAEALMGGPWPIVGDAPECPDDAAELFADGSEG